MKTFALIQIWLEGRVSWREGIKGSWEGMKDSWRDLHLKEEFHEGREEMQRKRWQEIKMRIGRKKLVTDGYIWCAFLYFTSQIHSCNRFNNRLKCKKAIVLQLVKLNALKQLKHSEILVDYWRGLLVGTVVHTNVLIVTVSFHRIFSSVFVLCCACFIF